MTPFNLLRQLAGLSLQKTADALNVRLDTVKSWDSGRRGSPDGALHELRALIARQERAAAEALALIAKQRPAELELGYAADDHEAQSLGWPCVGAQAAVLGRILAGAPNDVKIHLVPRGSTVGTAAAADAREAQR